MDTVFDHFQTVDYDYLDVSRGEVYGNVIKGFYPGNGVFKLRNSDVTENNRESEQSDATLHVRPSESFATVDMVGNGIRIDGLTYEIIAQTAGLNFDTNELEHYRLTLQRSALVEEQN